MMVTTTLYNYLESELIKHGHDEFVNDEGELVYFEHDSQFMTKILRYDEDIQSIVDYLFSDLSLTEIEHDTHFKRGFIYRFINRQINRQTIEAFKLELLSNFITNEQYINRLYIDGEKYVTQTSKSDQENNQVNSQTNDGTTTSDNRQAYADLPQNNIQLDVDSTIMDSASDNTITRNKQTNLQDTEDSTTGDNSSESKSYHLDELFKSNGLLESVYTIFDRKCFIQVW